MAEGEDSLQKSVRESLSADTSFHHVLLSVVGEGEKIVLFVFPSVMV